jgi:hypothetical protein
VDRTGAVAEHSPTHARTYSRIRPGRIQSQGQNEQHVLVCRFGLRVLNQQHSQSAAPTWSWCISWSPPPSVTRLPCDDDKIICGPRILRSIRSIISPRCTAVGSNAITSCCDDRQSGKGTRRRATWQADVDTHRTHQSRATQPNVVRLCSSINQRSARSTSASTHINGWSIDLIDQIATWAQYTRGVRTRKMSPFVIMFITVCEV